MRVSGNHHDIIRQRLGAGTVQSISTYWCAVKVYAEFERVVTGADDFAKFVTKMYEAYDRYVKNTLYDALVGYVSALTGQFKKTGSLDEETLNALCDAIETVTGYPVRIMGTKTALRKVMALNTEAHYWSEEMKNARYKDGMLGWFNGNELVAIPQVYEKGKIGEEKISNNLIWIMPVNEEKFIKLVNEGDTQLKNISDKDTNMDATYEQEIQTKLGVAVMLNGVFGVYEIDA